MNKKYIPILIAVLVIAAGVITLKTLNKPEIQVATPSPVPTTPTATYTLTDVAAHKASTDCWTAVNGKVYNVTPFIENHPGGQDAILSLCGKDGSAAFDQRHGEQRRPESELTKYVIGELK